MTSHPLKVDGIEEPKVPNKIIMTPAIYDMIKYLDKQKPGEPLTPIPTSLILCPPSNYEATLYFGETLLNIGENSFQALQAKKDLKNMFCIKTYALEYGITKAIDLILSGLYKENIEESFPKIFYNTCSLLPKHLAFLAIRLEKIRLLYELSESIAEYKGCVIKSYYISDLKARCSYLYLKEMSNILNHLEEEGLLEKDIELFYNFSRNQLENIIKDCKDIHIKTNYSSVILNYKEVMIISNIMKILHRSSTFIDLILPNPLLVL
jgi:hypothetical protein